MDPLPMPRRIDEYLLRISRTSKYSGRGVKIKKEGTCVCPRHESWWGGEARCTATFILNVGDRNEWPTSCPDCFTPVKKKKKLNKRLGGPHSRSEHFGEEKNILALSAFEPPIVQPVAEPPYLLNYRRGREGVRSLRRCHFVHHKFHTDCPGMITLRDNRKHASVRCYRCHVLSICLWLAMLMLWTLQGLLYSNLVSVGKANRCVVAEFWDATPCSLVDFTDFLEESAARIMSYDGSKFLRNVDTNVPGYLASNSTDVVIFSLQNFCTY
jgi:hypothetical protein